MATSTTLSAQDHSANFTSKQRVIALTVAALAFVMDLLDSTIVNVAIPSIKANLHASYSAIQWIVAGYLLAFALLLVTGGRMGDVFGYKKVFMFGVAGFTLASLLSGLAVNPEMLIASRILQGACAALMVPQVMSLMQIMYKPEERGGVNGLFGALGGLSASLGPVVGGLLIKANIFNADWRPIFLINVPIGIVALIMAAKYVPRGKSPHPLKLDVLGTVLIVFAMLLLVFPLIEGRDLNWPVWSYIMMVASLPVFAIFWWWQRKKEQTDGSPLILPMLFKNRSFGVGLTVNFVFEMAMISFFLTFGLLLQIGLGFSPIKAALTGIPVAVGIAVTMAVAGEKLIPKLGRAALSLGTAIMAVGLVLTSLIMQHYAITTHPWQLIPSLLIVGIGMGMVFGTLFAAVLNGVDARHAGSASGTLNAMQQIGGAVGVAIVGVIFFGQLSKAAPASFDYAYQQQSQTFMAVTAPFKDGIKTCYVDRSREKDSDVVPQSCQSTNQIALPPAIGEGITRTVTTANAHNFTNAFRWSIIYGVCLLGLTFSISFLLPKKFKAAAFDEI